MKGEKQNKTKKTLKAKLKSLRTFLQPIMHPSVGPPAAKKVRSVDACTKFSALIRMGLALRVLIKLHT